jgi:hypothetical protein
MRCPPEKLFMTPVKFFAAIAHHSRLCCTRTTQIIPDFHYVDLPQSSKYHTRDNTAHLAFAEILQEIHPAVQ